MAQGFSPADKLVKIRDFTPAEIAIGQRVRVEFGNLAKFDSQGRRLFCTGFVLRAHLTVGTTEGTNASTRELLGTFGKFAMHAAGVPLFEGNIDGRHLQDDVRYRLGAKAPIFLPEETLDGGHPGDIVLHIAYPFGDPWAPSGSRRNDLAIPLGLLDHRRESRDVLEFDVQAPPGLWNQGVTVAVESLTAYAMVRSEITPIVGALPRLIETRQTQLFEAMERSSADRDARLDYAVIRHRPEDEEGEDISVYRGLSVRHGQDQWLVAQDADEAIGALYSVYDGLDQALIGDLISNTLPIAVMPPRSDISEGAAYPIYWDIESRGDNRFTRVMRRERITMRTVERQAAAAVQGVPISEAVPEVKPEKFESSTVTPDFIPQRIRRGVANLIRGGGRPRPRSIAERRAAKRRAR